VAEKITVSAHINASKQTCWDAYTLPEHIVKWNFAHESWHCPSATNDLRVGGTYFARMEARDGSSGFDFIAVYSALDMGNSFAYGFGDREAKVAFTDVSGDTEITVSFDAETENPVELQRNGWQAILNNYKSYAESL
jgi:uncharacterized protein YndB with AHSA1/START domain